jgi:hypothetical protein
MRWLPNFDIGVVALALACRFLLPSKIIVAFGGDRVVRGLGLNRAAFWLVLAVGLVTFIVKVVRR